MAFRVGISLAVVLALSIGEWSLGQSNPNTQPWRSSPPAGQAQQAAPPAQNQPVQGQPYGQPDQAYPPAAARPQAAQPGPGRPMTMPPGPGQVAPGPTAPPWADRLTPQQQAYVDQVLRAWETHGDRIEMFVSNFARRVYEPDPNSRQPGAMKLKSVDVGVMKYKKPDKGFFQILGDPQKSPEENKRQAEKWICDGRAFYHYDYVAQRVTENVLPPDMQGKGLGDGPVPFVFGAKAAKMKERYWICPLPAPRGVTDQIYLEVWPRHQKDAADFRWAEVILSAKDMRPIGIRRYFGGQRVRTADGQIRELPGNYETFTFDKTEINPQNLFDFLKGDPFTARVDSGWTKIVKPADVGQAGLPQPERR